jgi:hypothetical protein
MATKNEKIFGTLIGTTLGIFFASRYANKNGLIGIEKIKCQLMGLASGGISGYGMASLIGSPNNTVNYKLLNKKRNKTEHVYDGITYEHRIRKRNIEHSKSGKIYTHMVYGKAKPRVEALRLEKSLIIKNKGIYNKQHNSKVA